MLVPLHTVADKLYSLQLGHYAYIVYIYFIIEMVVVAFPQIRTLAHLTLATKKKNFTPVRCTTAIVSTAVK